MGMEQRQAAAAVKAPVRVSGFTPSTPLDWFLGAAHKMNAEAERDIAARDRETRELVTLLRDTTDSRSVYDRCIAIVGER